MFEIIQTLCILAVIALLLVLFAEVRRVTDENARLRRLKDEETARRQRMQRYIMRLHEPPCQVFDFATGERI